MRVEEINPFVRFTAKQIFTHGQQNMCAYDHRIYFGLKNVGTVVIDGVKYEIKPDTFILWRAGTTYSYFANDVNQPIEIATCNFDFTKRTEQYDLPIPPSPQCFFNPDKIVSENAVFEQNQNLNKTIYLPKASQLRALMITLCEEYKNKLKYYNARLNTILHDILLQVTRLTENEAFPRTEDLTNKILAYIQSEYRNNPTNMEIGKMFGYHPNYINSLIVKQTGTSIHQYVLSCKMNKAVELLMNSNLSVREISEEVNIPDVQYFSRLFKKFFKKTPSSFRNYE